jgi:hypothetical protein
MTAQNSTAPGDTAPEGTAPAGTGRWYRNRFLWVAVILLAVAVGAAALVRAGHPAEPADLQSRLLTRMRTTLEQVDPGQHNHGGHGASPAASGAARPRVICGVRIYGYEPSGATTLAQVRTVYGFHLCGVAEPKTPWDGSAKLVGPVILDMSTDPPGIQVVEATAQIRYADRLQQMFPPRYAQMATTEALSDDEMASLRRRYDAAAGV